MEKTMMLGKRWYQCTPWINLQWGILFIRVGEKRLKHGGEKDFQEQSKDEPPSRSNGGEIETIHWAWNRQRYLPRRFFGRSHVQGKGFNPTLKETLSSLGGLKSEIGQAFITDIVLTDLTSILRQKRYTATWRFGKFLTTPLYRSCNPRSVCNIFGQVVVEDGDEEMDSALFSMSLWDSEAW